MRILLQTTLIFITSLLVSCGVNPVTGKSQVVLVSQEQEIKMGEQYYSPSQQSQGGAYVIDKGVSEYVNRIGQALAKHSAQPDLPYEFVVLNNDSANAWALPGGKIAINRGLLEEMEDEAQLASVLGHEIVHAAARHGAEQQTTGLGLNILAAVLQTQTDNQLYQVAAGLGARGVHAHYGRENELEADYYGIRYMVAAGYDPQGAVELQQVFLRLSQEKGGKSNLFSRFFASHPPSAERVEKNQQQASQLPKGKRNKVAYQEAMKQLKKDEKAYDKHEEAAIAAKNKEWDKALSLTNEAIKMQPKEARFHITKGRIYEGKEDSTAALKAFDRAVTLEPSYFMPFYFRGIARHETENFSGAKQDFIASNKLYETSTANYYLGEISLAENNRSGAIQYYQRSAQMGGDAGKAAAARLQELSQ